MKYTLKNKNSEEKKVVSHDDLRLELIDNTSAAHLVLRQISSPVDRFVALNTVSDSHFLFYLTRKKISTTEST